MDERTLKVAKAMYGMAQAVRSVDPDPVEPEALVPWEQLPEDHDRRQQMIALAPSVIELWDALGS